MNSHSISSLVCGAMLLITLTWSMVDVCEMHAAELRTEHKQITFGLKHHFFGYIGHVRTIPWNQSGRYIVALRTDFQDHMPKADDAAEIVLLDTANNYAAKVVDRTRAWNFQQGTMLYWNPAAPETQFFFNDRDPATQDVYCVLFDISRGENGERIAEYRHAGVPIGNSGVAQKGGWFLGLNYARLARLRPVTGYPATRDPTAAELHPAGDGIFKVNVATRQTQLLVSYRQLGEALKTKYPEVVRKGLFINHTMWSRNDERIYFFVRGDFEHRDPQQRLDVPFTMAADGSDLRPLAQHIGGHVEWETDRRLIGAVDGRQIIFDIDRQAVVETLGTPEVFPSPKGDIALSPDGTWFVNGHTQTGAKPANFFTIFRRADGVWTRTGGFDRGQYTGELRIDPAPCWNRDGTKLLVGGLADDAERTRQLSVIRVINAKD